MAFPWSGKKDAPGDAGAPDLEQLAGQLDQLGGAVLEVNRQLTSYLVHRDAVAPEPAAANDGLAQKVDALAEQIRQLSGNRTADAPAAASVDEAALKKVVDPLAEKLQRLEERLSTLQEAVAGQPTSDAAAPSQADGIAEVREAMAGLEQRLHQRLGELAAQLAPPEEDDTAAVDAGSQQWMATILGPDLMQDTALQSDLVQFQRDLLSGDAGAQALAGQLLAFRSAPPERLPQLLKEVGEAYYRWRPKTAPGNRVMEETLAAWLARECEAVGISNSIELVHPGERFDNGRHTAASRGVEITEVRGWIVLRDNGRVYTKATVAVR
jgi:hypothetical protein